MKMPYLQSGQPSMKVLFLIFSCLLAFQGRAQLLQDSFLLRYIDKLFPDSTSTTTYYFLNVFTNASPQSRTGQVPVQQLLLQMLHKKRIIPTVDALEMLLERNPELIGKDSVPKSYSISLPPLPPLPGPARRLRRAEYRYYSRSDTALSNDFMALATNFISLYDSLPAILHAKGLDSLRGVLLTGRFTTGKINRMQLQLLNEKMAYLDTSFQKRKKDQTVIATEVESLNATASFVRQYFVRKAHRTDQTNALRHRFPFSLTRAAVLDQMGRDVADGPTPDTDSSYIMQKLHIYKINFYVSESSGTTVSGKYHIKYGIDPNRMSEAEDLASTAGANLLGGKYYFDVLERPDLIKRDFVDRLKEPARLDSLSQESGWGYRLWTFFWGQPVYALIFRVLPGELNNQIPK